MAEPLPTSKSHGTAIVARKSSGTMGPAVQLQSHNIMGRALNVNIDRRTESSMTFGNILNHNMLLNDQRQSPAFPYHPPVIEKIPEKKQKSKRKSRPSTANGPKPPKASVT